MKASQETRGRKTNRGSQVTAMRRRRWVVGLMGLALLAMVLPNLLSWWRPAGPDIPPGGFPEATLAEPPFRQEGSLRFLSGEDGTVKATIDIEVADNDMERQFGLMYRKSMGADQGMLFLFEQSEPQGFWMKNTFIPLDILFVDENRTILNIHEHTVPHSESTLASEGPARYVVEVNGGFSAARGIRPGDRIAW
jgi:uncharacterized membrane protein (UPF0127 family)